MAATSSQTATAANGSSIQCQDAFGKGSHGQFPGADEPEEVKYSRNYSEPRYKTRMQNGKSRTHISLSRYQRTELEREWRSNEHFTYQRIAQIAHNLHLKYEKVKKWIWDRKKGYLSNQRKPQNQMM